MQVGQNTTFSQIYNQFRPGPLSNSDQHLRLTGTNLHTHNPLMPHGKGAAALQARQAKYDGAATAIKDAIAREHSPEIADRVFQSLKLGSEVRLRDLRQIKAAIERETTLDVDKYRSERGFDHETMLNAAIEGRDQPLAQAFETYGKKWLANESFEFLRAVHDYRQDPTAEKARQIVDTFIDGDKRVNPTDRDDAAEVMFRAVKDGLGKDPAKVDAFDDVYREVFAMTASDVMGRFVSDQVKS